MVFVDIGLPVLDESHRVDLAGPLEGLRRAGC
jgi:hypothetical protein